MYLRREGGRWESLHEVGEWGEGVVWGSLLAPGPSAGLACHWALGSPMLETLFHLRVSFGAFLPGFPTPSPFPLVFWTFLGLRAGVKGWILSVGSGGPSGDSSCGNF